VTERDLRGAIVGHARSLFDRGLSPGTSGNIRLPLVPYAKPGDAALADAVRARARESHALLLANHGPIVAGPSLDAAASAIEEIEETAKLVLLLRGLPTRQLSPGELEQLRPSTGAARPRG
jgi:ribulose-5-phosphate 4-epimerase/fuculose-1-phosphate aldolase